MYDDTINLVTRDKGVVFERYDYSPFGLTRTGGEIGAG